jgi:preprotein translocase subunit YajC
MYQHFLAMATNPNSAQKGGQGLGIIGFLPWIAIILIIYFLMIRPQSKRQKQHQAMLKSVTKGDKVVTAGGIHGVVMGVKENSEILIVKIDEKVKVEIERSSIARVIPGGGETEL